MDRREALRWVGSVGIFYVLIPAWVLASDRLYATWLPWLSAPHLSVTVRCLAIPLGLVGLWLAFRSIRSQIVDADGHPFDLTGRERFSRPTKRLLRDGVYFWTRNPMGLGDLLFYAALALAIDGMRSLVINVPAYYALVWYNHRWNERPSLLERFGDEFRQYERTTSVIVPAYRTMRKLAAGSSGHRPK